jgi:NAD(P)-dependent dehydrogenase (short-subunit alcohol dehydrogenase family)
MAPRRDFTSLATMLGSSSPSTAGASLLTTPAEQAEFNAGVHRSDSLGHIDFDRIRLQLETNALGPIRVTEALLPNLKSGAKVAIITSRSGSIGDNGSSGNYGYRMSKAAVNMAGVNLALDLKGRGIAVAILHPGMVRTGMGGSPQAVEPADAARRLMARIDEPSQSRETIWANACLKHSTRNGMKVSESWCSSAQTVPPSKSKTFRPHFMRWIRMTLSLAL